VSMPFLSEHGYHQRTVEALMAAVAVDTDFFCKARAHLSTHHPVLCRQPQPERAIGENPT